MKNLNRNHSPNTASRKSTGITLALPQGTLAPARSAGECNAPDPDKERRGRGGGSLARPAGSQAG